MQITPRATVSFALAGSTSYVSIPDIIMYICQKNERQANQIFRQKQKQLQLKSCIEFRFPCRRHQVVAKLPDALRLIETLPREGKRHERLIAILDQYANKETEIPTGIPIAEEPCKSFISFGEVVPYASVRVAVIDGVQYLSVKDMITYLREPAMNDASKVWNRILDTKKDELSEHLVDHIFPGTKEKSQPAITFPGALKLLAFIPGQTAWEHRPVVVDILRAFYSGDASLLDDVPTEVYEEIRETSVIPFDDIVPGATVRLCVVDGKQYLSVRDVIMHVCGKNANNAADVWRTLAETKKTELTDFLGEYQFPGRGNGFSPVITFPGVLKLIMFLPGEVAMKCRSIVVAILTRYFAGDPSMLKEIEENGRSDAPMPQLARASLASEGRVIDEDLTLQIDSDRKRKRDQEDTSLIREKINNVFHFATAIALFDPKWNEDVQLRTQARSAMSCILQQLCAPGNANNATDIVRDQEK